MHDPVTARGVTQPPDGSLRLLVTRLAHLAQEVRSIASQLESTTSADWQSLAAERFRRQLARDAHAVRQAATRLDEAQHAMAAHCAAAS